MSNDIEQLQDSTTPDENEDLDLDLDSDSDTESDEPTDRERRLYARLKKTQEKLKSLQKPEKPLPETEPVVSKTPEDVDSLFDNLAAIRDLAADELQELRAEARVLGVNPITYIKSKAGKAHLDIYRKEKKDSDTTPPPSKKGIVFKGKTFQQIALDPKASKEDKQAAFEATMNRKASKTLE
jgi:hypothetical protein